MAAIAILCGSVSANNSPIVEFDSSISKNWLISDWPAGQSHLASWRRENVRVAPSGYGIEMVLNANESEQEERPYAAAEIQSRSSASYGAWAWRAQVPEMTDGAVFGMFLYRASHTKDPWREYDFEFVGADTTKVQLNIHFQAARGERRVSIDQARGAPVIVDLGFDAAKAPHLYEIEVSPGQAIFRVDGEIVGSFTAADLPDGVWNDGPLRSFVNLWPVSPAQEAWAGEWASPDEPLIGIVLGAGVPEAQ